MNPAGPKRPIAPPTAAWSDVWKIMRLIIPRRQFPACVKRGYVTGSVLNIDTFFMSNPAELKRQIKRMLVENLMLQNTAEEIGDDQPLFGPGGLGLDSVDALQVVVALDKNYGLKIPDPETARKIIYSVNTITTAVENHQSVSP